VLTSFIIAAPCGWTCIVVLALVASSKLEMQTEGTTLENWRQLVDRKLRAVTWRSHEVVYRENWKGCTQDDGHTRSMPESTNPKRG
jgi:hypothetical protein